MRTVVLAVAAFLWGAASPAFAVVECGLEGRYITPSPFTFVATTPPRPRGDESFTLNVGRASLNLQGASEVTVSGNTINFYLRGNFISIGLPPPIDCGSVALDLGPGKYTLNVYVWDAENPASRVLVATAALDVGSSPANVPTNTPLALLILTGVLLAVGSVALARR